MALFHNYPVVAALLSIVIAQLIKIIVHYGMNRRWNFQLLLSSGAMPSSHSAAVAALSTSVGLVEGVTSPVFAVSMIVSVIIMFDAAGIRRQAGNQAVFLNKLIEEFSYLFKELGNFNVKENKQRVLKELIGHKPIEVFVGAVLGVGISFICKTVFP